MPGLDSLHRQLVAAQGLIDGPLQEIPLVYLVNQRNHVGNDVNVPQ